LTNNLNLSSWTGHKLHQEDIWLQLYKLSLIRTLPKKERRWSV